MMLVSELSVLASLRIVCLLQERCPETPKGRLPPASIKIALLNRYWETPCVQCTLSANRTMYKLTTLVFMSLTVVFNESRLLDFTMQVVLELDWYTKHQAVLCLV